ncbi:MAG TPA: D-alanyl-D-alanine carboxypeptidase/D-alanyl-D-alanine-endopeptidase [Planctomycetota bacterium]|nr:D-alanyl-D-alanine carboxypeptidase/D-alanyl-D-alanine-endopeptidase [Planctomycetota bacterium]
MLSPVLLALALRAPSAACGTGLPDEIRAVIEAPDFRHAHWGILFVDRETGETVHEWNADKLFAPASVTKLFSVAAALETLGAEFRFETPIVRRGEVDAQGRLAGDLILVASGDLTMGGRTDAEGRVAFANSDHTYANGNDTAQWTQPDPLAGLDDLGRQVGVAGIRRVDGEVLLDDRLFERAEGSGSGPRGLTPILVNDNLVDLLVTPAEAGAPAKVDWRPRSAAVRVDAQVETVGKEAELKVDVSGAAPSEIRVRGRIPAGHAPLARGIEVGDAAAFARALLIEALRRSGVVVAASPLGSNPADRLPEREEVAALPPVAALRSPPFAENARLILKVSHNLHASTLPLLLAARAGRRTLQEGLALEGEALRRLGVPLGEVSFGGGAGGSRADYATPRATVALLRAMAARPDGARFEDALPVLGVDGTLAKAVDEGSPARGRARAKTGTLFWDNGLSGKPLLTSKALAGHLTTAKGRRLVFAIFVGGAQLEKEDDTAKVGRVLGRLCEIVCARG